MPAVLSAVALSIYELACCPAPSRRSRSDTRLYVPCGRCCFWSRCCRVLCLCPLSLALARVVGLARLLENFAESGWY
eukprot:2084534-Prymnesium_polylepis.3